MQYDHVTAPDHGAEEISEHGIPRRLGGWSLRILTALALAFSTFQLVIAAFAPISSQVTRSLHVGFLLLLAFVLYPSFRHGAKLSRVPRSRGRMRGCQASRGTYSREWSVDGVVGSLP